MSDSRCPHCWQSSARRCHCEVCNREMCEDCISYGSMGEMCGLCKDREDARRAYRQSGSRQPFDEWYDQNG